MNLLENLSEINMAAEEMSDFFDISFAGIDFLLQREFSVGKTFCFGNEIADILYNGTFTCTEVFGLFVCELESEQFSGIFKLLNIFRIGVLVMQRNEILGIGIEFHSVIGVEYLRITAEFHDFIQIRHNAYDTDCFYLLH